MGPTSGISGSFEWLYESQLASARAVLLEDFLTEAIVSGRIACGVGFDQTELEYNPYACLSNELGLLAATAGVESIASSIVPPKRNANPCLDIGNKLECRAHQHCFWKKNGRGKPRTCALKGKFLDHYEV